MIKSQLKSNPNHTLLILDVPDAILGMVAQWYQEQYSKYAFSADLESSPPATSGNGTATVPPAVSGGKDMTMMFREVELAHQLAQVGGDTMRPSQRERIVELLGTERAAAIFGPHWGYDAWGVFTVADPMKLERDQGTGKWKKVPNEKHLPDLLAAFLTYDIKEWLAALPEEERTADEAELTNEQIVELIAGKSYSGNFISPEQRKFLLGIVKNGGKLQKLFPGNKAGDGNEAANLLIRYAMPRIKQGGQRVANPNYSHSFVKYLEELK
ncbi:MAG: hypothetical protein E6R03_11335 [Hyphomicrobiaceae bacterium]|nr:MAG: hypothetical protein E6R03_11335 [Hyphomicrobiaceae bacterium]